MSTIPQNEPGADATDEQGATSDNRPRQPTDPVQGPREEDPSGREEKAGDADL
ncbi:hypothetical protein [Caballeronia glathei]|uniref:hypothetical protein n=1 Tax=Caballeronia glathei TaxID=60547 RepID=UPI0013778E44|nr:hypothetical protein [Caballeronia glathei]